MPKINLVRLTMGRILIVEDDDSDIDNLRDNARFDPDALYVKTAFINGGQPLKRFTAAAQGRATPIRKRTSHVEILVATKES